MAILDGGTASANAASSAVHALGTLMLSTDTGDLRVADGTHTFAATPNGFILLRKTDLILTGYTSGAGTVASTDTILQAIQKLNGNDATNANLTGPITSGGNATAIASQTGTGTKFVVDTAPTFIGPVTIDPTAIFGSDQTPAETLSGSISGSSGDYNIGFKFTPNINGQITHLAFYSTDTSSHLVQLFSITGTVLASATVAGVGGSVWQRVAITAVPVTAATAYVVAYRSSVWSYKAGTLPATLGSVTINEGRYDAATNSMPTNGTGDSYLADVTFQPAIGPPMIVPHLVGNSSTPSIAAGAGAGTSPTIGIVGTDLAGQITLTSGLVPSAASVIFTVTFNTAYAAAPNVVFSPANANAAGLNGVTAVYVTSTTTTFVFDSGATGITAALVFVWNYHVIG